MDPAAVVQQWIDAVESGDEQVVWEMIRNYRKWISGRGFPYECKAWSERVFGVPVHCVVLALGTKYAACKLSYNGQTWGASLTAGNLIR